MSEERRGEKDDEDKSGGGGGKGDTDISLLKGNVSKRWLQQRVVPGI